jgi:hypothetical protein
VVPGCLKDDGRFSAAAAGSGIGSANYNWKIGGIVNKRENSANNKRSNNNNNSMLVCTYKYIWSIFCNSQQQLTATDNNIYARRIFKDWKSKMFGNSIDQECIIL